MAKENLLGVMKENSGAIPHDLAWTLLAPELGCGQLSMVGWGAEQLHRLAAACAFAQATNNLCVVINVDAATTEEVVQALRQPRECSAVIAVGSRRGLKRVSNILAEHAAQLTANTEYGLLPRNEPRLAVPLHSVSAARSALKMHTPGRWSRKVGLYILRLSVGLGVWRFFGYRIGFWTKTQQEPSLIGNLRSHDLPINTASCALYFGGESDAPKSTLLVMSDSVPVCILKIARAQEANGRINHEAAALNTLGPSAVHLNVPKLLGVGEFQGLRYLVQEYVPRIPTSDRALEHSAIEFLAALLSDTGRNAAVRDLLDREQLSCASKAKELRAVVERLSSVHGDTVLPVCLVHGDFAPWNCAATERGFFVYDWEMASEFGIPFSDAFYYVISQALHLRRTAPAAVVSKALVFADRVAMKANIPRTSVRVAWQLWIALRTARDVRYEQFAQVGEIERCSP